MKLKLLTTLLLTVSTLFFIANANAVLKRHYDPAINKAVEIDVPINATREEISKALADKRKESFKALADKKRNLANKRKKSIEDKCIAKAGKMNNEFPAKKLYKPCLADEGL